MEPSRLREIVGAMTPGPWGLGECSHGGKILLRDRITQTHIQVVPIGDALGIAALRSHAEALLDVVEAADHPCFTQCDSPEDDGAPCGMCFGCYLRAALARLGGVE